ncbi:MAG: thiol:disulfide interchange protein DsbA/DsbL [Gammaproteobacteria bacterium]|nr:thiol:disulfide interchange protein DsbA/DsbL [Gammaproteobacteria bacterium]MCW8924484.1 thiol:disulfide interchange protein DsbA/DsbL [Gammaproteobacteria bacterium]
MLKKLAYITFILFLTAGFAQAAEFVEGEQYTRVAEQPTETGDKIEVLEFFWYGCPHCYQFEPILQNWLKTKPANVEFVRVPAVFRPEWKVHARTYYALQAMGLIEKYHSEIFDALHKDRADLYTEDKMIAFLVSRGVNEKEFRSAYASFSIDNQLRKAIKKLKAYGISGVPSLAVNGKYLASGSSAGTYENMLRIVDHLIEKEAATADAKK